MQTVIERISGKHYRALVYPSTVPRGGRRGGRDNPTEDYRQRLNDKRSAAKLAALLEENFRLNDLFVTLTYREEPVSYERAAKNVRNFLRQYRTARKAAGLPYDYIYVIEGEHGDHRKHHHIVTSADGDAANLIKSLWLHGFADIETIRQFAEKPSIRYPAISLNQCVREYGGNWACGWGEYCLRCFDKLAHYITKEPRKTGRMRVGSRMYVPSLTLRRPTLVKRELPTGVQFEPPNGVALLRSDRTDNAFGSFLFVDGWTEKTNNSATR